MPQKSEYHINQSFRRVEHLEQLINGAKGFRLIYFFPKYCRILLARFFQKLNKNYSTSAVTSTFFSYPLKIVLPGSTDLYLFGMKSHHSEIRLTKYILRHVKPNDIVIDGGAHFGYFTLLFSYLVGDKGHVYAIEPSNFSYAVLVKNCQSIQNTSCFQLALGHIDQSKIFHEFPAEYSEYNAESIEQYQKSDWIEAVDIKSSIVKYKRLDSFLNKRKIKPAFIKIDVEGAEWNTIKGLEPALDYLSTKIILEFINDGRPNDLYFKTSELLISRGFYPHSIDDSGILQPISDIEGYFEKTAYDSDNFVFLL